MMKQIMNSEEFENIFLSVFIIMHLLKEKGCKGKPMLYKTNQYRKVIMRRSALGKRYYKSKCLEDKQAFKKQRNYCNRLCKRGKRNDFNNLIWRRLQTTKNDTKKVLGWEKSN